MRFFLYCLLYVSTCYACPYGSINVNGTCTNCSSGSYFDPVNMSSCLTCAPGTFWTPAPAALCTTSVWLYRNSSTQYYLNLLTPGVSEYNNHPYNSAPDTFTTWTKVRFSTVLSRWNTSNLKLSYLLTDNPLFGTDSPTSTMYMFPFASAAESGGSTYASMTGSLVGTPFAFSPGAFVCSGYQYACIGPTFSNGNQTVSGSAHGNGGSLVFYGALTLFNSTQYQTDLAQACGLYPNDPALACFGNETVCNTACQPCGTGFYASAAGALNCSACPAGTFAGLAGSSVCLLCAAGTYSSPGASACLGCRSGYNLVFGNTTACAVCAAGSYYAAPFFSCVPCAAGFFGNASNATNASACAPCPAGLYGNSTGLTVCSACPAGYYETGLGSTGCTGCAGGSYDTGLGMPAPSNCVLCGVGTYSTSPDAPTMMDCTSCPAGTYGSGSGSNASAACVGCAPGLFASGTGFSSCAMCAAGLYGNASALSACRTCAAGSVTNASGLSSCSVCAPGTVALATTCWACAPGTYSTVAGAVLVTPYVAPPPAPSLSRNGSQLPVGVGQYCTYYVPGPSAVSDVCYLTGIQNVHGVESPCDNPLLYNYTLCANIDDPIDNMQVYICDVFSSPACPWPLDYGCELIGNASEPSDSCDSPSYPGYIYATRLVCEEGCAAVAPCTNGADGVYLGAGFTTANSCPVQCNPGYILNPVTNACACAGGACVEGLSPCLQCPVGSYQTASGATTCAACAAGTFSESTGAYNATECAPCPAGYYCASGALLPCPTFTSSPGGAGAVTQCQCAGGYACAAFVNVSLALYYAGNFTNYTGLRAALQTALGGASVFFS